MDATNRALCDKSLTFGKNLCTCVKQTVMLLCSFKFLTNMRFMHRTLQVDRTNNRYFVEGMKGDVFQLQNSYFARDR